MSMQDQDYMGDGVYVAHDGIQIWLRANDNRWGMPPSTSTGHGDIALEPQVLLDLMSYALRVGLMKNLPTTKEPKT
jgi:hypothetical protein